MSSDQFFPYGRQSISQADIQEVSRSLAGKIITRGEYVEAFEKSIADYCGAKYAVAFNSGTTALIAACHAAELGPADRVISTPNTFVATVNACLHRKATPVFVDIDRTTGNLDLNHVAENLRAFKSTRGRTAIMPVHFGGIPVEMQRLDRMIRASDTIVIEDAAHALGSRYSDGQMVGCCAWSQMTVFSFHPVKTITTGEGGMVTTNDPDLAYRLKRFRNNGIERDPMFLQADPADWYEGYYEVFEMTGNYNFTDFQAALGLSQLQRIDEFIEKRRQLIGVYRNLLMDMPDLRMFTAEHDDLTAFHLCVVQIDFEQYNTTRAHVIAKLKECGVGTQVHYIPVYRHPIFGGDEIGVYFPNMEAYFSQALTLPLYYDLTPENIKSIVITLKDILVEERQKKRTKHRSAKPAGR